MTLNEIPFYVGKTKNPDNRKYGHSYKYPGCKLEIIDEVPVIEWKFWERHYISLYRSWGFILKNIKLHAGNGADVISKEQKLKISLANTGKRRTQEQKDKMSIAKIGIPHSSKQKAAMSKVDWKKICRRGPMPEEYLKKLLESGIRRKENLSTETIEKMKLGKLGKTSPKIGRKFPNTKARRKLVSCTYEDSKNTIWNSISEAATALNLSIAYVSLCCNGKRIPKGYSLKFIM